MNLKYFISKLKARLDYHPDTGIFRWREGGGRRAGFIHPRGYTVIKFNNQAHSAQRLAWLMTYGHWPNGMIRFLDGDRLNLRIANLANLGKDSREANLYEMACANSAGPGPWYYDYVNRKGISGASV